MIKKSLLLLLTTLLFTACVERGQTLKPTINTSMAEPITKEPIKPISQAQTKSTVKSINTKKELKEIITPKNTKISQENKKISIPSIEVEKISQDDNHFFTLSDETKNKISGFFIIVIGILILI